MIAVISDVHANLPALEAVLAQIDELGCTRIWCLGDTVGYGPWPSECVDLVLERCEIVLAGNHERALVGDPSVTPDSVPGMFSGGPGAGLELARRVLRPQQLEWLAQLSPQRIVDEVELYHGSRRDPVWEYVRSGDVATGHLNEQQRGLSAVGHTHAQLYWELQPGAQLALGGRVEAGRKVRLDRGPRRVFNPGSVGQPRDHDPRAAWALLHDGTLEFRRTDYEIARTRAAVTAAGLPEQSGERLELGI